MFKIKYIFALAACLCFFATTAKSAAGDPDPTSGSVGFFTTSLSTRPEVAKAVGRQPDGKFIVIGNRNQGFIPNIALVRYNPNGTLDASFDGDGVVTTAVNKTTSEAVAAALQQDGKIVTAGAILNGARRDITVWRYLNDENNVPRRTAFDYDGDGRADVSVFRPSAAARYRLNSLTNQFYGEQFGVSEDKPAAADYDGDGRADIAVFRPSQGSWYIQRPGSGFFAQQFGVNADIPTPAAFKQ